MYSDKIDEWGKESCNYFLMTHMSVLISDTALGIHHSWCCIHHSWWCYQMETFSALLASCAGNSPVTGKFPAQRPVTRSVEVFFICAWINSWVNNREAGDLRRHHAHYDAIVMYVCAFADACVWCASYHSTKTRNGDNFHEVNGDMALTLHLTFPTWCLITQCLQLYKCCIGSREPLKSEISWG